MMIRFAWTPILSLILVLEASAADLGADVHRILRDNCAACHTESSREFAGVRYRGDFDYVLDLARIRESDLIDLETPEESELYALVREGEMPHSRAVRAGLARTLTHPEVATLLAWIRAGAPDPSAGMEVIDSFELDDAPTPFDPETVERGRVAFENSCTPCHDASRALGKTKELPEWRQTIRRMAGKSGAHIPRREWEAIAAYLTFTNPPGSPGEPDADALERLRFGGSFDFNVTLSTTWRGSARDDVVENEGFFPEVWIGGEWHPTGPWSARVTACTTCHSGNEPEGNRIELVEGLFRFDAVEAMGRSESGYEAMIDAGRFVVPFGSFGGRSHPAAFRTVTKPLMFNMGQNVNRDILGPPVVPMPYADEGLRIHGSAPLSGGLSASLDTYVVNGLAGGPEINFFQSRDYTDNNSIPAVGGRVTLGHPLFEVGGSMMAGQFNEEGAGFDRRLRYELYGVDVSTRVRDLFRLQGEYAQRKSDQMIFPAGTRGDERVDGYSIEGDVRILPDPGLSLIARYDTLGHDSDRGPPSGLLTDGDFSVRRFTWGFNFALPGGSSLFLNHEHWSMPDALDSVDVIGIRWIATF